MSKDNPNKIELHVHFHQRAASYPRLDLHVHFEEVDCCKLEEEECGADHPKTACLPDTSLVHEVKSPVVPTVGDTPARRVSLIPYLGVVCVRGVISLPALANCKVYAAVHHTSDIPASIPADAPFGIVSPSNGYYEIPEVGDVRLWAGAQNYISIWPVNKSGVPSYDKHIPFKPIDNPSTYCELNPMPLIGHAPSCAQSQLSNLADVYIARIAGIEGTAENWPTDSIVFKRVAELGWVATSNGRLILEVISGPCGPEAIIRLEHESCGGKTAAVLWRASPFFAGDQSMFYLMTPDEEMKFPGAFMVEPE